MRESERKSDKEELAAQRLKAVITDQGETALRWILEQARSFRSGLPAYAAVQSRLDDDDNFGQDAAIREEMREPDTAEPLCGVQTIEYAPKLIMRTDKGAGEKGSGNPW